MLYGTTINNVHWQESENKEPEPAPIIISTAPTTAPVVVNVTVLPRPTSLIPAPALAPPTSASRKRKVVGDVSGVILPSSPKKTLHSLVPSMGDNQNINKEDTDNHYSEYLITRPNSDPGRCECGRHDSRQQNGLAEANSVPQASTASNLLNRENLLTCKTSRKLRNRPEYMDSARDEDKIDSSTDKS